ncbi:uncharacterized protein LOC111301482 [Durio zibethinus]|uniref:Uncharacterized protein LOC111301482 n=1 Tax=Durio zibethinus TaxID=66656 RepID=A0A6P5ZKP2_DURZI|nr:uncharacterized protein LOC111301482 [Durio zibethinus]
MNSLGNAPTLLLYIVFGAQRQPRPGLIKMRSKNLMANLRRSSKDVAGGRSKPNEGCKRHPKHRQSPGVCSLCLGEKLSQLSANSSRRCTTITVASSNCSSSSSLSSYYSSASSSSSSSSPMHRYCFPTEGKGTSFSLLLFSGKNILTKSRSVAFASRMRIKEGDDKKKESGLLSKLLHSRNNKREKEATGLEHFRTMRETLISRVH